MKDESKKTKVKKLNPKNIQEANVIKSPEDLSQERVKTLVKKIFKSVNETAKEVEGDFSYFELQDAFVKVSHHYNSRALMSQFDQDIAKDIEVKDAEELKK